MENERRERANARVLVPDGTCLTVGICMEAPVTRTTSMLPYRKLVSYSDSSLDSSDSATSRSPLIPMTSRVNASILILEHLFRDSTQTLNRQSGVEN